MVDLVLLHAFPLDGRMWDQQIDSLNRVARVHPMHLPGFGPGSQAPLPASVDDMAAAVHLFVRQRGLERFVLGGMSMGGYVSLAYWRRYGSEGRLVGLMLLDTKAAPDDEAGRKARDENIRLLEEKGSDALVDRLLPKLLADGAASKLAGQVRNIAREQRPEAIAAGLRCLRDRPDSTPVLPTITVPTLVVCGERDAITPVEEMRGMARQITGSTFLTIPRAGHLSNLEEPDAFDAALRTFLIGLPAQDGALQPR